jgi:tetratricopeptide (TPR) repeat protein
MKMNKNILIVITLSLLLSSCYRVPKDIEPKISYSMKERHFDKLYFPFPPLSEKEKAENWSGEYLIGKALLKTLDLYRAISSFKRAEILIPENREKRKKEMEYYTLLSYYLGQKYDEVINYFNKSSLPRVDKSFPVFSDLLVILYDSYLELNDEKNADKVKKVIDENYLETSKKLNISTALLNADLQKIENFDLPYLNSFLDTFNSQNKSIPKAQALNAIIPGAGYLYLGQKRSALTTFLVNGLFIWASYEFFKRKYIAAGIITTSFELGWYFGGIYGAGEEAKYYNERIYEREVTKLMNEKKLFPFFMLTYTF